MARQQSIEDVTEISLKHYVVHFLQRVKNNNFQVRTCPLPWGSSLYVLGSRNLFTSHVEDNNGSHNIVSRKACTNKNRILHKSFTAWLLTWSPFCLSAITSLSLLPNIFLGGMGMGMPLVYTWIPNIPLSSIYHFYQCTSKNSCRVANSL